MDNKEQEFAVRQAWKALLFATTGAFKNIHAQLDRLETELEIAGYEAQEALSRDIAAAVKNIREQVLRLESRLDNEDTQIQRTVDEELQGTFVVSAGSTEGMESSP